ncbi:MAG: hypothetical protein ACTHMB_08110 [Candidatus Binatia bacterium]
MRTGTIAAWIFVGFGLLIIGTWLQTFGVLGTLGIFVAALGLVYFVIGWVLSVMHGRHLDKRTRAGRE